jgi:hypothetical protein
VICPPLCMTREAPDQRLERIDEARGVYCDGTNCMIEVQGMLVIGGAPLESYATIASVQAACRALQRCGRPGMGLVDSNE